MKAFSSRDFAHNAASRAGQAQATGFAVLKASSYMARDQHDQTPGAKQGLATPHLSFVAQFAEAK